MPKYVYDPKSMTMVPQQKRGIEYTMTGEGIRITDNDNHIQFVITRNDECKLPGRRIEFDCKRYDSNTARQIAGRVQRIYPNSKYRDFRYFAKNFANPYDFDELGENVNITPEDKALLRSISESYEPGNALEYVEHLNEADYFVGVPNAASSQGQTPGVHQTGVSGLVKALPSALFTFLVCPPAAIMGLIGAIHTRAEKRWVKSFINPNRWMDFIAYPAEKKQKVVDKIKEKMAENCKYYYTRLANGEILRVVGCSTLEAKEMIMAIERKDIIPRYDQYDKSLNLRDNRESTYIKTPDASSNNNYIMWVIKFNNGEACYAFGTPDASDKEDIMEKAIESREAMVEYYKKIVYHDEDNDEKKKQKHRTGIDKEKRDDGEAEKRLFKVPEIDDMIRIENPGAYKIIDESNFKEFTEPQTSPLTWQPAGRTVYKFKLSKFGEFTLPVANDMEVKAVLDRICSLTGIFASLIRLSAIFEKRNGSTVKYCKCSNDNRDYFIMPFDDQNDSNHTTEAVSGYCPKTITEAAAHAKVLFDCLSTAMEDEHISNKTQKEYRSNRANAGRYNTIPIDGDADGTIHISDWEKGIYYQKIDARTQEPLSAAVLYADGTTDNAIEKEEIQISRELQDIIDKINSTKRQVASSKEPHKENDSSINSSPNSSTLYTYPEASGY